MSDAIDDLDVSELTKTMLRRFNAWNAGNDGALNVIGEGLCYLTICTSLSDEEADARMAARPATVDRGWTRSADTHFHGGQPNPCPCEEEAGRRHVLYEC